MSEDKRSLPLDEDPIQILINDTIKEVFKQVAQIELQNCTAPKVISKDLCTVYTEFTGGYTIHFAFCAEKKLLKHIAENMLDEPITESEDIEECAKEFLNILCGHMVKTIFGKTKTAARFHSPYFIEEYYVPETDSGSPLIATHYTDEQFHMAILINDKFSSADEEMWKGKVKNE